MRSCDLISSSSNVKFNIRISSPVPLRPRRCGFGDFLHVASVRRYTYLINDRGARPVPESDMPSGNSDDHRFVDQIGAAIRPGVRCEISPRRSAPRVHGEISQRRAGVFVAGSSAARNFTLRLGRSPRLAGEALLGRPPGSGHRVSCGYGYQCSTMGGVGWAVPVSILVVDR